MRIIFSGVFFRKKYKNFFSRKIFETGAEIFAWWDFLEKCKSFFNLEGRKFHYPKYK